MLLHFILIPLHSLITVVSAQTCSDSGIGSCLPPISGGIGVCPTGFTCIAGNPNFCCDDTKVVTGVPPPPTNTCGDAGLGQCLQIGTTFQCPTGSTCITTPAGQVLCCTNSLIGVQTTTAGPPLGCRDNASANCAAAASYCSNDYYYNVMTVQCPITCNRCGFPTRAPAPPPASATTTASSAQCQDNPTSRCSTLVAYCSNAAYYDLLTNYCPVTCGRCAMRTTPPPVGNCADLGTSCMSMQSYCNNAAYYDLMTQQCPRTCNRCGVSSSTCYDKTDSTGASNCASVAAAGYCTNAVYYDLMTQQCPRTCGRCSSSSNSAPATSTCVDLVNPQTGLSDCPIMASYCNNPQYYTLMTQQCPRTCGRCSTG